MSIKIICDSASDIDEAEAKTMGITVVPMEIRFSEQVYLDGVNLSHKEFFEKLIESAELPKTSQINPYTFELAFENALKDNDEVICITISSKLSGTFQSAKQAAKKFGEKVFVVDSLNASIGERLLIEYALKLAGNCGAREICNKLNEEKKKVNLIALLDTLKYLKKGGRISALTAFAGEMMSIKPVIGIIGGEVKLLGKAIGSKKGNNLLNNMVRDKGGIDFSMPYGVVWSGLDNAMLLKYLADSEALYKDMTDCVPAYLIGSTIGTHIGPGAVGVAFFGKNKV